MKYESLTNRKLLTDFNLIYHFALTDDGLYNLGYVHGRIDSFPPKDWFEERGVTTEQVAQYYEKGWKDGYGDRKEQGKLVFTDKGDAKDFLLKYFPRVDLSTKKS